MIVHQTYNSLSNHAYNSYFYKDCDWYYHFHKNYELIYVLSGEVELTRNGQKFPVAAGYFALVLPNEFHAYRTPESSYVWIGVFSSDFVGEFSHLIAGKQALDPRFCCDGTTMAFLREHLITMEARDVLLLKAALYAACREFYDHAQLAAADRDKGFIYDIIAYVSEHFREEITLVDVAEAFGYEYHYLSRQFHRYFDINFKQFLNIYRMDHAREQLLRSDASITEIAFSSGFPTIRTFNRVFTQHTGRTPSEFRKNAAGK